MVATKAFAGEAVLETAGTESVLVVNNRISAAVEKDQLLRRGFN